MSLMSLSKFNILKIFILGLLFGTMLTNNAYAYVLNNETNNTDITNYVNNFVSGVKSPQVLILNNDLVKSLGNFIFEEKIKIIPIATNYLSFGLGVRYTNAGTTNNDQVNTKSNVLGSTANFVDQVSLKVFCALTPNVQTNKCNLKNN